MAIDNRERHVSEFFDHYCEVFNKAITENTPDIELTAALFSACFIAAHPSGVNCGQNDEKFRDAMRKGYAFYQSIGIFSMDIVSRKITLLDAVHAMSRIRWKCQFRKRDGLKESIEFDNIYFTQTKDDQHKVFAYVTGDEQAALKKAGLV